MVYGLRHFYLKCKNIILKCVGVEIFYMSLNAHNRVVIGQCTAY
jgi:hypothetical protein